MSDTLIDIQDEVKRLVEAAYKRGYDEGSLDMRNSILAAAQAPMVLKPGTGGTIATGHEPSIVSRADQPGGGRPGPRARRGLVAEFIRSQLTQSPGLTIKELEERAQFLEPEIGKNTVGNQLRRFDGKLYVRDGYRWFLNLEKIWDNSVLLGPEESAGDHTTEPPADIFAQTERR